MKHPSIKKGLVRLCGDILPIIFFVVVSLVYFWGPIQGHKVLTGSDHSGAVGSGIEIQQYRAQHNGETPRWTNTLFSGMPTYQMAPSYDSTNTLSDIKSVYMLGLPDVAAYVFIFLLGFYIMMRCFDFKVWMAALGAVLWAFSSYFFIIIAAGHIWKVLTLAFIPPTIGGMALCYRGKYGWGIVVTGLFMALQIFSNHVQMTYYFLFVIGIMAIAWFAQALLDKEDRKGQLLNWFKASCAFALGCLIGVAVNISNLYHTWEYSKESMRGKSELTQKTKDPADQTSSGLERSYITMWSYGIGETWTLLVPNTKGGASQPLTQSKTAMESANNQYLPLYQQLGQYWGDQPGTSGPVYVGAFVCMLFILGLLIVRGPMCWGLLIATMLSIALSWGKNFMGFTDFFLDYVPMYDKFRTVASILVIAEFTIPLLAMMALKKVVEEPDSLKIHVPIINKEWNALFISFIITAGILLLFWLMPDAFFGDYTSQMERDGISSLGQYGYPVNEILTNLNDMRRNVFTADVARSLIIVCVGTFMIVLFRMHKIKANLMVAGILVLCLVDMWGVNKRYLNDDMFVYPQPVEQTFAKSQADEMILQDKDPYNRVLDLTCSTFNSNDAGYWHKSIGGYHAAKLRRYQEVIENHITPEMEKLTSHIVQTSDGKLLLEGGDSIMPVLNMLNMKYVIVAPKDGAKVAVENPSANGNAWFVNNVQVVANADDELAALGTVDLKHTVVCQKEYSDLKPQPDSTATVRLTSYGPVELKYEADSKKGGVIVFSDIYYPGWTATVDGQNVPVQRVDYILRAIQVPEGKHEVIMTFDPQTVHTTEMIAYSALALLGLIVIGMIIRSLIKRK